jgi:predicted amidophosphoribosyltransferase
MICDECGAEIYTYTSKDGKAYCKECFKKVHLHIENHRRFPGCDNNPGGK